MGVFGCSEPGTAPRLRLCPAEGGAVMCHARPRAELAGLSVPVSKTGRAPLSGALRSDSASVSPGRSDTAVIIDFTVAVHSFASSFACRRCGFWSTACGLSRLPFCLVCRAWVIKLLACFGWRQPFMDPCRRRQCRWRATPLARRGGTIQTRRSCTSANTGKETSRAESLV